MLLGLEKPTEQVETYNVGSEDQVDVKTIAQIITEETGLKNVKLTFTGGLDGEEAGWKTPKTRHSTSQDLIKGLG
jgi:UDP-glucose 4-epimerase